VLTGNNISDYCSEHLFHSFFFYRPPKHKKYRILCFIWNVLFTKLCVSRSLQLLRKIDHINKLRTAFVYRMIVIVGEKVLHLMRRDKSAFFIKWYRRRAVTRADLKNGIYPGILPHQKVDQCPCIPLSAMIGVSGDIFDLENTLSLVGNNAFSLDTAIIDDIHPASFQISVYHTLLLVREQKQIYIPFFIFLYLDNSHNLSCSGERARHKHATRNIYAYILGAAVKRDRIKRQKVKLPFLIPP